MKIKYVYYVHVGMLPKAAAQRFVDQTKKSYRKAVGKKEAKATWFIPTRTRESSLERFA